MKTILVSMAHLDRVDDVINTASAIAQKNDSHVIGFYPIPGPTLVPVGHPGGYMPLDDRLQKYYQEKEALSRAKFEDRMSRDGLQFEWRSVKSVFSDVGDPIVEHGREADLIIMSQGERVKANNNPDVRLAADVILAAGRPVLIIPPLNGKMPAFSKAVIGWNASREACRAAFDSIPLIKMADEVHLTWVNPGKGRGKGGRLPGTELAAALARHDINITTNGLTNRANPGVALVNYARDKSADLLILGAYGHSRLRERILGGATEYVLRLADIPVLLSN